MLDVPELVAMACQKGIRFRAALDGPGFATARPIRKPATELAKAQRIVGEELSRRAWTEPEVIHRAKGHPEKVAIARRLRKESTMSLKWIAQRLHMGSWTYVSNLLRESPLPLAQPDLFKQ